MPTTEQLIELDLESPAWMEFVRSRDEALPFHHPSWALLLSECYGFRAFALALENDAGGGLRAGFPVLEVNPILRGHRWVSLPFTDVCPPLADEADTPLLAASLEDARRRAGIVRVELRAPVVGGSVGVPIALRHTLRLEAPRDQVARRFHPSVRRNIRAAEGGPLTLRRAESEADLDRVFYELQVSTLRRHGLPVQPPRFFRLLWRRILEPGLGFALFAYKDDDPVAGAVFLTWNRTVTFKYGASHPEFWGLRPNNLLFWNAISWACDQGYASFDFGRTDFAGAGLRQFKLGWGCDEHELRYTLFGGGSDTQRVPSSLLRQMLRHSPAWVIRAAGKLLYRQGA